MTSEQGSCRPRSMGEEFGWMLVPSLAVGVVGTFAFIAWFASLHWSSVLSATTGRICLIAATGASLAFGAKATRLLLGCHIGKASRLTSWLILLVISGIVLLLILDVVALCRM